MGSWRSLSWTKSQLLLVGMSQSRGAVSIFSRLSGDMISCVNLPRAAPDELFNVISELVARWIDTPLRTLELRYSVVTGRSGYKTITINFETTHCIGLLPVPWTPS